MRLLSIFARPVCVLQRNGIRDHPCSRTSARRLEDEHHPVALKSVVEHEPLARPPTFALGTSLDADAGETRAGLHNEVVCLPGVRHLGCALALETELAEGVMLPSVAN